MKIKKLKPKSCILLISLYLPCWSMKTTLIPCLIQNERTLVSASAHRISKHSLTTSVYTKFTLVSTKTTTLNIEA